MAVATDSFQHIWRDLQMDLPGDWELLRFSSNVEEGRIAFADRYRFRLELSWKRVPSTPLLRRIVDDYAAKLDEDDAVAKYWRSQCAGWRGLISERAERVEAHYIRHLPALNTLLEAVFLYDPAQRDGEDLERFVLASIRAARRDANARARWRCFGFDLSVPAGYFLDACVVHPAYASMTFKKEQSSIDRVVFERRGMVNQWLTDTVAEWSRDRLPKKTKVEYETTEVRGDHKVRVVQGRTADQRIMRPSIRNIHYASAAWQCPRDGRLYSVTSWHRKRPEKENPVATLTCCDGYTYTW